MSLMISENGITTTSMATTREDIQAGMLARTPALGAKSAFDAITIRAICRGPFTGVHGLEIFHEQSTQALFRLLPGIFTANDFHRRFQIPKLADSPIRIQRL